MKALLLFNKLAKTLNKCCSFTYRKVKQQYVVQQNQIVTDEKYNKIYSYHTCLKTDNRAKNELLSVTVVHDNNLEKSKIIERVKKELKEHCGIDSGRFIKHYYIPHSLPDLKDLQCSVKPPQTGLADNIFLAGDSQLNGSLNAAIDSGEEAAMRVIEKLSN